MKTKLFTSMIASIFLAVFLIGIVSGVSLAEWDLNSNLNPTSNLNIEALAFEAGSGVNSPTAGANGAFTSGWSNASSAQQNDYVLVTIRPKTGYSLTITDLDFEDMRSSQGPESYNLMWIKGSNASGIFTGNSVGTFNPLDGTSTSRNLTLNSVTISDSETFAVAWFGYEANASTGTLTLDDIIISGSVSPISQPTTQHPEEIQEVINIGNLGGNLKIDISDISVIGFGDDDQYWYPMDEIELEIELENDGPEDIDNIEIGFGLWNVDEEDWVIDDDRVEEVDIKDGDEEIVTITFQLDDPDELQGDNFILYVWAIGEDDEFDGNDTAEYDSLEIDIINDDDFVILDNIEFSPETGNCGDLVQITADIWNIGDNDQDDVSVVVSSSDLGISERVVIGDINDFDNEPFTYTFEIPEDADEKRYIFTFEVYDEDNDIYETDEEEDEAKFTRTFDVAGGCRISGTAQLIISANLESGGKAGEQLVVRSTINNLENSRAIVSIEAEDYSNWADLVSVSPTTAIIEAGDSKEVTFTFNVNKDVSGEQTFNIVVTPENAQSVTQPVEVLIEESNFLSNLGENTIIYILAGLIVVVILLIVIVLIVRASRR
ncbi:putative S-layer protein [Candidatus Pacearchaeota archaeon]|nr:putative S-layer protein [Candidatus Pacearchaeota archaeon]